jgi:hypothetical protein
VLQLHRPVGKGYASPEERLRRTAGAVAPCPQGPVSSWSEFHTAQPRRREEEEKMFAMERIVSLGADVSMGKHVGNTFLMPTASTRDEGGS